MFPYSDWFLPPVSKMYSRQKPQFSLVERKILLIIFPASLGVIISTMQTVSVENFKKIYKGGMLWFNFSFFYWIFPLSMSYNGSGRQEINSSKLVEQNCLSFGISPARLLKIRKWSPITSQERTMRKAALPSIYTPLLEQIAQVNPAEFTSSRCTWNCTGEKKSLHSSQTFPP